MAPKLKRKLKRNKYFPNSIPLFKFVTSRQFRKSESKKHRFKRRFRLTMEKY